jgi:hypothetical protein
MDLAKKYDIHLEPRLDATTRPLSNAEHQRVKLCNPNVVLGSVRRAGIVDLSGLSIL